VVKGSPLLPLLRRIRRRVRFFAAIEGGISGGAIAGLALAAGIAIVRRRGGAPATDGSTLPILLGLTGVLIGAALRAGRRIPLARCARIADAALDGQDRVLSAWCLVERAPSPLVAALVADALGTASRLAPGGVVPARRPKGLPALGLAALALCGAVLFPVSSRAARTPRPSLSAARRPPLGRGALDVEREEVRAALAEAAKRGDARLAALAADFDRAVRGLSNGTLADGEALDLLRALETRAAEAARDADRDGRAADAAARALGENPETKAAGQALAAGDEGAGERARAALGASAGARPAETGRALAAAARGVAGSSSDAAAADAESGPRRLARSADRSAVPPDQTGTAADGSGTRHLEQLRRDLDDTAAACRDGDPGCRARAETRAQDLARLGRQAASADGLRRLERAAGQMRARASRGELREGDALAARSFGRAANGESQKPGDDGANDGSDPSGEGGASRLSLRAGTGDGDGDGDPKGDREGNRESDRESDREGSGAGAGAQAAALSRGEAAGAQPSDGTGNGIGKEAGGAPLGARDDTPAHGNETEAHLASGGGPSRASVIGAAAGRGFVAPGYARVFTDYATAVEDALSTTAVPEGKRFIVRRYFDLIRPRSPR
jgi:hypothetical protein